MMAHSLLAKAAPILLLTLMPLGAHASSSGGSDGGGGKVVVCRRSSGKIHSVELLDLWEARTLYGRQIQSSSKTVEQLVKEGIENLKNVLIYPRQIHARTTMTGSEAFAHDLLGRAERFLKSPAGPDVKRLHGVKLTETQDSFELAQPVGCSVEQAVNYLTYVGRTQIYVNQDLVDAMNNVNQAALILHESLYSILRELSFETNSIRTRRAIGLIASGAKIASLNELLQAPHLVCESELHPAAPTTRLHYISFTKKYPNGEMQSGMALVAERLAGVLTMGFGEVGRWMPQTTVEDYFKNLDPSRVLDKAFTFIDVIGTRSDIDLEMDAQVKIEGIIGKIPSVNLLLERTPNGRPTPVEEKLVCRFSTTNN